MIRALVVLHQVGALSPVYYVATFTLGVVVAFVALSNRRIAVVTCDCPSTLAKVESIMSRNSIFGLAAGALGSAVDRLLTEESPAAVASVDATPEQEPAMPEPVPGVTMKEASDAVVAAAREPVTALPTSSLDRPFAQAARDLLAHETERVELDRQIKELQRKRDAISLKADNDRLLAHVREQGLSRAFVTLGSKIVQVNGDGTVLVIDAIDGSQA